MISGNITYKNITDKILAFINNNCQNVGSKYDSMDACFKSYDTGFFQIPGSVNAQIRFYLTKNKVERKETSNVNSDFENFLKNIGVYNKLNQQILDGELYHLINNMVGFCIENLKFSISQYSSKKYLIYTGGVISLPTSLYPLIGNEKTDRIDAKDVNDIFTIIMDKLHNKIRVIPVEYTVSLKDPYTRGE